MDTQDNLDTLNVTAGAAHPLGSALTDSGCNFAVYCPDARAVLLCLFHADTEEPAAEILLPEKTGDVWHAHVETISAGQLYGYRVERGDAHLHASPTDKLLIDPYARKLSRPQQWDARQYRHDSQFMVAKSVVIDDDTYTPARSGPVLDDSQRILYETHIKGLTRRHPDVPKEHRGTYLGAAHPAVIDHLVALGVTSVQFMPLAAFMPEPYIVGKGMTNYWGYNPVNFFAPEPRYAISNAVAEIKTMVDAYHEAGLEVIVDVVFNHTAEGGKGGPVLSFKGMCPLQAYMMEQAASGELVYANHSGCGNTINTAHPAMTTLILDAMRFWCTTIGVDGFRFDLAVCLGRDPRVFHANAGLLRAIKQDPVLGSVTLIAEPWDIGPGGYQLGGFPSGWLEVNDKFRDTVRAFWRGDEGITADFATRLMGSRDIFHKGVRRITTSVNHVTYHDGFTLHDLVSYAGRHNDANGENNEDGHGHNLSANYGAEGETQDANVLSLRERQKRNFVTTLLLSQGTPHFLGGDELSKTQQGNNNAYCQDNDINWYQWELNKRKQDFLDFCRYVIALRKRSSLFSEIKLDDDHFTRSRNVASIQWYKPDGSSKASDDWQVHHNQAFGVEVRGCPRASDEPEHWFLCINASDNDVRFNMPVMTPKGGWTLELDTRYSSVAEQPAICIQQIFLQAGKSVALFSYARVRKA